MTKLIWKQTSKRTYRCDAAEFNAVLFGATEPAQLWAWSIWWQGGQASAVQTKFADAKNQADKNIALIVHRVHLDHSTKGAE